MLKGGFGEELVVDYETDGYLSWKRLFGGYFYG